MDYHIALSPELGISPADFATAWNELAEAHTIGEARVAAAKGEQFDLTLLATILISVGTGAASNIISDLIMKVFEKRGVAGHKHTHIEQVKRPDGSETFVVDIDEE
ncbi:MAG TPA: hypothetical protein DEV72_12165 [Ktedonobacter sp.]|nr:hypothetical protein [Ktedonobacter sp.]